MKTLILFYSYTGKTKLLAEQKAAELSADIEEVKTIKKPFVLRAYFVESLRAMRCKKSAIAPIKSNLDDYDTIIIMAPIWAGSPAPAVNSIIDLLPKGKEIELLMVSASGTSGGATRNRTLIEARGCTVTTYINIKA